MIPKEIILLNLCQLKSYMSEKSSVEDKYKTFYKEHWEEISDTYFFYQPKGTYCRICPITNEVLQGGLQFTEYFVGMNYHCHLPQFFERSHTFKIVELPIDDIVVITKEEFIVGLKEQLQDALDKV